MIAGRSATAQTVANIRTRLGLDQPLLTQFWTYLQGIVQGNLGLSSARKTDVGTLIAARLPATLVLMATFVGVSAPQFVVTLLLLYALLPIIAIIAIIAMIGIDIGQFMSSVVETVYGWPRPVTPMALKPFCTLPTPIRSPALPKPSSRIWRLWV